MKQIKGAATSNTQAFRRTSVSHSSTYSLPGATFGGVFSNSLQALWSHRQRSILTMLGIVIGIAAFIGVISLSQGATASFLAEFDFMARTITVNPSAGNINRTPFMLTAGDIKAMSTMTHVVASSPTIGNKVEIIYGHQTWNTGLQGVSSDYQEMQGRNMRLSTGTWWSKNEDQTRRPVVVLGSTVVKNLSPAADPVGQTIRIDQQLYRVIGTLKASGINGFDNGVYVPYTVVLNPLVVNQIQSISVEVDSVNNLDIVQAEMKTLLEQRHHILPGTFDGFDITEAIATVQQNQQFLTILSALMISIATISLVVGGVGIMNIMLISVTERTREIGLRTALGAQPWDISLQFLLEALVLSLIGGGIGLFAALLLAGGVTSLIGFPLILNALSFILAFGVATAIGVGFGLYPAIRASRLDPIVALRSA